KWNRHAAEKPRNPGLRNSRQQDDGYRNRIEERIGDEHDALRIQAVRRRLRRCPNPDDTVTIVLWSAAVALILVGIAGVVVPAVPGVILVFAGMALGAWIDDFARIPVWVIAVLALLAAIAWVVDFAAGTLGAKRAGASGWAIIGAALGTLA